MYSISNIKTNIFRRKIFNMIFIKGALSKTKWEVFLSIVYSIFMVSISLLGLVPIIFNFIDPAFNETSSLSSFYIAVLFFAIVWLIDYLLRLSVIDIYYNVKYLQALKKQLWSISSNFQFLASLIIIILVLCYGQINDGQILFVNKSFTNDIAMIVIAVLFLINLSSLFPRIIVFSIDIESVNEFKKILYKKRISILITLGSMLFAWLIFSFIIFKVEQQFGEDNPMAKLSINSMGDAMYFCFVTMTTVGFGDFVPISLGGRIIVVILAIFGVCFYGYVGSIFVNLYLEYVNKKRSIRKEAIQAKNSENTVKEIIKAVDIVVLKNLLNAKLITETKYKKLIMEKIEKAKLEKQQSPIYTIDDLTWKEDDNKLIVNGIKVGNFIENHDVIKKAENKRWLAVFDKSPLDYYDSGLFSIPLHLIDKIKKREYIPIIFTSRINDPNIKRVIFYQRKPYKHALLEAMLFGILVLEKDKAWKSFGLLTGLSKNKFDSIFKNHNEISILIVKEYIVYHQPRILEKYGINTNLKVHDFTYLK